MGVRRAGRAPGFVNDDERHTLRTVAVIITRIVRIARKRMGSARESRLATRGRIFLMTVDPNQGDVDGLQDRLIGVKGLPRAC